MGTVRFGNDHFAAIIGYSDYVQGNITVCHVYYVEGLRHNLFSVRQFCDGDLEVAFRSKTCYVRNLEGDDLLTGDHESNLYIISISDMAASSPICFMSKATSTKSWLWHRRLSHLNFGKEQESFSSTLSGSKYSFQVGIATYGFMRTNAGNINQRKAIRTDNGTKFKNANLKAHYDKLGIMQQFSIARTPQQNGVVERCNRTLVEAARTIVRYLNIHKVEFQRISLTGFRSCTSRSYYQSVSKQTTRYPCEASYGHKIEN
ncbi:integrase, catalytic region, zinc finger, CCHC-type containing protein [Tanacetum coccineum]